MSDHPALECQECGRYLRYLTPAEVQQVAANPYNFIAYCILCQKSLEQELLYDD